MSDIPPSDLPPVIWPPAPVRSSPPSRPRPAKPRVWTVYVAFVSLLVSTLVVAVVWLLILLIAETVRRSAAGLPSPTVDDVRSFATDPLALLPDGVFNGMLMLGAAILPTLLLRRSVRQRLRLVKPHRPTWACIAAAIGAVGYSLLFDVFARRFELHSPTLELLTQTFHAIGPLTLVLSVLVVGGIAPLAEEIFFRGYVQTRLEQRHRPLLAILIASLLFGIIHMDLIQGTFAFGFGFYLGIVAWRTGSIYPAILGHAFNNTLSTLASRLLPETSAGADTALAVGGAVVAVLGLVALARPARSAPPVDADPLPPTAAVTLAPATPYNGQ